MKVVKLDGINAPYGKCVDCGCATRSHVLEYPDYEEYEEQVFRDREEYQAAQRGDDPEEDAEYVIRYKRLSEPEVMCHKCWVLQREKASNFFNKNANKWQQDMPNNITKIRKFLKDWVYFDFSGLNKNVVPIPDNTDIAVLSLRKSVKSFLTGDEEE
tara:strand:+ start:120 stop:590 length:471 start_codon:yes stop_codon:yes gene_type:complete